MGYRLEVILVRSRECSQRPFSFGMPAADQKFSGKLCFWASGFQVECHAPPPRFGESSYIRSDTGVSARRVGE